MAARLMLACSSSSSSSSLAMGLPSASSSCVGWAFLLSAGAAAAATLATTGSSSSSSPSTPRPNVVSRSITSRNKMSSDRSSSRQIVIAWKVSGLSQSPAIIVLRPASMRFAIAISPSRDSSSTLPISRRYIRTGSSVRSSFSVSVVATATSREVEVSTTAVEPFFSASSSSASSSSVT